MWWDNIKLKNISSNGVRVGEHNILTSVDCEEQLDGSTKCNGPVQDLTIEQVIAHPRFNSSDRTNDIGLLRVSRIDLSVGEYLNILLHSKQFFDYLIIVMS